MNYWKDKKVLITGGAGFIGSNLCKNLVAEGSLVTIIDNFERGRFEYIESVRKSIVLIE